MCCRWILEVSSSFNTSSFETNLESYFLNFSYNSSRFSTVTGNLNYNGTLISGTKTGSGDDAIISLSQQVPLTTADEDKTFHWELGFTEGSIITFANTSTKTQTVGPINFSACGIAPQTIDFLNWTFTK